MISGMSQMQYGMGVSGLSGLSSMYGMSATSGTSAMDGMLGMMGMLMQQQLQMMMQMMRRGRGMPGMPGMPGAMVDLGQSAEPEQKMSIGVDERTNSVVVAAPEPLFEEVRQLVLTLDQAASEENQTVQVLSLRNSNPETVQAALSTVFGDLVQSSGTSNSRTGSRSGTQTGASSRRTTRTYPQFPGNFMMRPGGSSRSRTGSRR